MRASKITVWKLGTDRCEFNNKMDDGLRSLSGVGSYLLFFIPPSGLEPFSSRSGYSMDRYPYAFFWRLRNCLLL